LTLLDELLQNHGKIGASACLAGEICRYDGKYSGNEIIEKLAATGKVFAFCPEVQGKLPTPREPAEIQRGDGFDVWNNKSEIVTLKGNNVTEEFKSGARNSLELLQEQGISAVILKEDSPSCACCTIYDGTFTGVKKKGMGVAAALFQENRIAVHSDESLPSLPTPHKTL